MSDEERGGRRLSALARLPLAALLVVALTACGLTTSSRSNGSAESFRAGYARVSAEFRAEMSRSQVQASHAIGRGLDTQLTVFRHILEVTDRVLRDLRRLSPPPSAQVGLHDLVAALSDQSRALKRVIGAATSGNSGALAQGLRAYASSLENGVAAQHQLDAVMSNPVRAGPPA